jgi:hypothetical protein
MLITAFDDISGGFSPATLRALLGDKVFELVHGLGL